ncbi:MAG TPA: cyclic nucleotide-binding domain-containing protein [Candidatus Limnocylindria bacterium]|nr:cyclic nucleotide-binding domain-containing protein [Candidatus Limnocylindria bacterium]
MSTDPERAGRIPLLAALKPKDRQQVLRSARQRDYAAGQVIVSEGDPATHLYLIAEGTARVERNDAGIVGRLRAGEFFGELGLIEEHGRTATVVADTNVTCLLIPAWEFRASLEAHPEMAVPMLHAIIARLHAREHHPG